MSRLSDLGNHLYRGDVSFDIVGKWKRWYVVSAVLILICLLSLMFRGLNFGVEFTGGTVITLPTSTCSLDTATNAFSASGVTSEIPTVTQISGSSGRSIEIQTITLNADDSAKAAAAVAKACNVDVNHASIQSIGPSWGAAITKKAVTALVVFVVAIVLYLSVTFEWRMAVAANVALLHDVFITLGIFSITGFEVTPASVVGLLTILGYSLYDTVVVFDKVKENTRSLTSGSRMTYSEAANLAVNQTLVRSINTSVVGLLPVASLLFVGAYVLGAGTLEDLALALFVGIAVGTYSSIFVATPVLAQFKEREPAMQALRNRVLARRASRGDDLAGGRADVRRSALTPGSNEGGEASEELAEAAVSTAPAVSPAARRPAAGKQRSQPRRNSSKKRRR